MTLIYLFIHLNLRTYALFGGIRKYLLVIQNHTDSMVLCDLFKEKRCFDPFISPGAEDMGNDHMQL